MAKPMTVRPEDVAAIAQRLRRLRVALGLNQTELSERLGLSRGAWNNYERGTRIQVDAAIRLLKLYRVSLDWIYAGETAMMPTALMRKIEAIEINSAEHRPSDGARPQPKP